MGKYVSGEQRKAGVDILILDKVDFRSKKITRDREGHNIMIESSVHQGGTIILNVYTPDNRAKMIELSGEDTIVVGDFIPF